MVVWCMSLEPGIWGCGFAGRENETSSDEAGDPWGMSGRGRVGRSGRGRVVCKGKGGKEIGGGVWGG